MDTLIALYERKWALEGARSLAIAYHPLDTLPVVKADLNRQIRELEEQIARHPR
jgi:hypothetical protein